ncbi:hypothetical protein BBK36DRAFT_1137793 [Trichoderma citrinoviride]|uniref:Secreted protein n=1 Tax=Trichoderma citrinoviride TaxID=58853 RepID=A0A2T4BJ55_9HYPO|nr:hypothetical protein BBK36DRAFT_1137793 [Trichoderma citrinoviride]PTB69354.1 hypothetical protein BBK36DRAFT_1137793 [Trichoderma citrinoviride]
MPCSSVALQLCLLARNSSATQIAGSQDPDNWWHVVPRNARSAAVPLSTAALESHPWDASGMRASTQASLDPTRGESIRSEPVAAEAWSSAINKQLDIRQHTQRS